MQAKTCDHITAPTLNGRVRPLTLFLFVLLAGGLAIWHGCFTFSGFHYSSPAELSDTDQYLKIAQGRIAEVMQPFASRQLGPLLVRGFSLATGLSVDSGFFWQGVVAILVTLTITGWFLIRSGAPSWVMFAVGSSLFWRELFLGRYLPDLWYASLLAILLFLLFQQHYTAAMISLLPLAISRETTVLVVACLLIVGWRFLSVAERAIAIGSEVAGYLVVKQLAAHSLQNSQKVSPLFYMIGKIPWNAAKNIFGIYLRSPQLDTCVPTSQITLPFGPIHTVTSCGFQPDMIGVTAFLGLARFGILPLLFLVMFPPRTWKSLWNESFFFRFCLVYGVITFLMGPTLGTALPRLFGYAWPLFMIAVPCSIQNRWSLRRIAIPLLALHLVATYFTEGKTSVWTKLAVEAGCYLLAWCVLRFSSPLEVDEIRTA